MTLALPLATGCAGRQGPPLPPPSPPPQLLRALPAGFPPPRAPVGWADTRARAELGRHLFYDARLSRNHTTSCAACHRQELAFTDGRARAVGATGEVHPRSAMSLVNVAYNASFTWSDPGVTSLEAQVLIPLLGADPVELGMDGREEELVGRLEAEELYRELFAAAFPGEPRAISVESAARALAAFERTLISAGSPYDRAIYRGDHEALSAAAWRGYRLFHSRRLGCSGCHRGFTLSGPVVFHGSGAPVAAFHNTGLYNLGDDGAYPAESPGLVEVTGRRRDQGRFRAPTLRNIAVTGPYMHDGSIATLSGVLDHYAAGGRTIPSGPHAGVGRENPWKSPEVAGFQLGSGEREDLLAFLHSLTDGDLLTDPELADPWR